ncbi:hypothetical protein LCGC14_1042870 [marine sediment metagenome]|uniref:Uncharacterized protein n=1 Tax=marine sediment metagenome TaxID=412755 RepID=A0A0F9MVN9_9ZZZZ
MDYVYPQDALPEMGYEEPKIKPKRCGTCTHGYVTNAGAVIPGYHCHLAERLYKEKDIDNGSTCVDRSLGSCNRYKYWKAAEAEKAIGAAI